MNGIAKVDLGLENCEVITIDGKFIGAFDVDNIKTCIRRVGCNYIGKYQICDSFVIEIHRSADVLNKPFGIEDDRFTQGTFDRLLTGRDITSITVYYDTKDAEYTDIPTGETDEFYVPYSDESEGVLGSSNVNQKCYKNKYGDLFIIISKTDSISDYFDMEQIEDEEYLNFHYSMLDIIK